MNTAKLLLLLLFTFCIMLLKYVVRDWYQIRACYFPYPEGYGTYNPFRRLVLDTGLSRDQAVECAAYENEKHFLYAWVTLRDNWSS